MGAIIRKGTHKPYSVFRVTLTAFVCMWVNIFSHHTNSISMHVCVSIYAYVHLCVSMYVSQSLCCTNGIFPITFLWLWPATAHEPYSRHVPSNKIWSWTETTPRNRWWCSHMAGINIDHSTHEINEMCLYVSRSPLGHQQLDPVVAALVQSLCHALLLTVGLDWVVDSVAAHFWPYQNKHNWTECPREAKNLLAAIKLSQQNSSVTKIALEVKFV